jgi:hypothetical protein
MVPNPGIAAVFFLVVLLLAIGIFKVNASISGG